MQLPEHNPAWRLGLVLLIAVCVSSIAGADILQWDPNGAAAPNPSGGSGAWSPTNSNWWNGSGAQAYDTGSAPHDAIFGVTGGTVNISSPVTARSLQFDVGGYVLSGGELTLSDSGAVTVSNASDTASVSAPVTGAIGLAKDGDGTLVLSGVNTFSGLAILGGTVSVSNDEQLGDLTTGVSLDGGTLTVTGSSSLKAADTRDFNIGSAGGTFDIQNSSNTGLTIQGLLNGTGTLTKSGPGTLRLDAANNMFAGGITIEEGVLRFNNNNDAGPKALRMNTITFAPAGGAATLSIGGSGDNVDGGASELRTGRWVSSAPGNGSIVAATTSTNADGASGHDLMIFALTDGEFSGTVANLATSNGGTIGSGSSNGDLGVRGSAVQTLSGVTDIDNTVSVFDGAGLTLSGAASITGSEANLNINGGTFTLDNSATNIADRFEDTASVETRGGGTFALIGNASGSSETLGFLQLGTNTTTPPNSRSGALDIQITHNAGSSSATVLTFAGVTRNSGKATVNFSARDSVGAVALGDAGNAPRIILTSAPSMSSAGLFSNGGSVGWATVNGSDFATYDPATGVKAVATVAFASAGTNDNALLTGGAVISSNKSVASLKIDPSPGQSLDLAGSGNLQTPAILLTGEENFAIRNTGGGTGGLATSAAQHIYVQQADLTIAAPVTGSGALIKSGSGTLILEATNSHSGTTTINEGQLRAAPGVSLGSGVLEFRGGVLEITGGGTFDRHLDYGVPSGSGRISWTRVTGLPLPKLSKHDRGSGGFAAVGADVTVDLNGPGASDIVWEDPSFIASGYALVLGSPNADARIDLVDNYGLGISPGSYNAREIRAIDNPDSTADISRISGIVFSDSNANNGVLTDLLKTGDGVLEFTGDNTYVSGTIVAEGALLLGHTNALGQGDQYAYVLLGADGGTTDAAILTSAAVAISRDITISAGSGRATIGAAGTGTSTFSGDVIVADAEKNVDLTAESGAAVIFSAGVNTAGGKTGFGTLTKTGSGKAVLQSVSNFQGDTHVDAGTLRIDGTLQCRDVFVGLDGVLGGTGAVSAGSVNVAGAVSPGDSAGILTVGADVIFDQSADLIVEIGGTIAGGQYDRLDVAGDLNLGGTLQISLINGFIPADGDTFDILNFGALNGTTFDSIELLGTAAAISWNFSALYTTGQISADGTAPVIGDTDSDDDVDTDDYNTLIAAFGAFDPNADFNNDGRTDLADFALLRGNFGYGVQSAPIGLVPTPTPEPATPIVLAAATPLLLKRKRKA
ncbi:MAG: autotransporter-associated beta strand repeat-containing protein [Phycisphaerae bacterium]|jgi:autotransporter-associated beta strand protein|nr:autotransporter-associated beta strand repeat-containing protein [Phycisphaerae bacterium]